MPIVGVIARLLFALALLIPTLGCVGPKAGLYPAAEEAVTIFVVHRGIHSGLVVPTEAIPAGLWPAQESLPRTRYLEVGWGDQQGYRVSLTPRVFLRALFLPTAAALYLEGFDESPQEEFQRQADEIIALQISPEGFARLCQYFQTHTRTNDHGGLISLGDNFYRANGRYHALQNSNHWTAEALRAAGCPITPFWALTADNVMFQCRKFGDVTWHR